MIMGRNMFVIYVAVAIICNVCLTNVNSQCTDNISDLATACGFKDFLEVKSVSRSTSIASKSRCNILYAKEDFAAPPIVTYSAAKGDESYTLLMIDPDAPKHPQGTYYLHWIVSNINGSAFRIGNIENNDSNTLSLYRKPGPPPGTGQHRYMYVVFRQTPGSSVILTAPRERAHFNLAQWVTEANSKQQQLCGPIAGVQFKAQY